MDKYDLYEHLIAAQKLVEKTLLHAKRQCRSCKRHYKPRRFAFVEGTKKRKKICRRCEYKQRVINRKLKRIGRRKSLQPKPISRALVNPVSYAPVLVKRPLRFPPAG